MDDNNYCDDCPECHYEWFREPGDFIFQSNRYCRLAPEDGKYKLLESWCVTRDRTKIPSWCPLKRENR